MMPLRCALAGVLLLGSLGGANAQALSPPTSQTGCEAQLSALGGETKKRFEAAKTTMARKATIAEKCRALTQFSDAEGKLIKFMTQQGIWCGVPSGQVQTLKANHAQTVTYQKEACAAAAQAARRPEGPSLSRALNNPVPDVSTTSTGRGTFDSLAGNPLR